MARKWKRLAALLLALVLCCGLVMVPASAVESRGIGNVVEYVSSQFWTLLTDPLSFDFGYGGYLNIVSALLGPDKTPETATEEDWKNAYTQYNVNIQNNYNTTQIGQNGYTFWLKPWESGPNPVYYATVSSWAVTDTECSVVFRPTVLEYHNVYLQFDFKAPASGYYTFTPVVSVENCYVAEHRYPSGRCAFNKGDERAAGYKVLSTDASLFSTAIVSLGVFFEPVGYDVNNFTQAIGGANSRIGAFSGNFGYYGDNGEMVVAENVSIVNETNNTYYNPVTGDTSTINEWNYDYSDRSYNVKLETGDTVNIAYGDENIVIRQGDTVYNVYYMVPSTPDPPPTPTPSPSVSPTPTPSSSLPPTEPPVPTAPVEPGEKPDTSGWGILDFLKGIFDFLWGLVTAFADAILNVLKAAFMPKEESVTKVQELLDEKLPFIADLKAFGDDFSNALKNPVAMVRSGRFTSVVDMRRKKDGVYYGRAQADILDVSWYLEYKDTVDDIIEGVAWLAFLWNLYGALPSIIHGVSSGVHTTAQIIKREDEHDP